MNQESIKFESFIRKLNYPCIRLLDVSAASYRLETWMREEMPLVVDEIWRNGWDMEDSDTWLDNLFCNHVLSWYNKRIAVFITQRYSDFNLANKVLGYKKFKEFRRKFKIDKQLVLLVHPKVFLRENDLDDIYILMDFSEPNGYLALDYAHCDENGELEPEYESYQDNDVLDTVNQYKREVYKYELTT